jgi:phage terminase large subunit
MPKIKKIYQPLYTSKKRYFILTGGRGSGKTFAVIDYAIRLLEQKGQGILYTRFTMTSAEKTIIPLVSSYIEQIADINNYHVTKKEIINKRTGSFILFSGIKTSSGDQTGNLKSLPNITTWIIEEGEDFNNSNTFTDIDDSIRTIGVQNRVIWIQNPTTREHFIFKRFFDGSFLYEDINGFKFQRSTHEDVEHIHTTYLDNLDNLDPKKIKQWELTKITNPKKYENKYIGAWLDKAEGVIFENWNTGEFNNSLPYIYGQDYGFSIDPTTLVKIAVDEKNKLCYWDELLYTTKQLGTNEIAIENKNLIDKPNDLIVGDNAEGRLIMDLKRFGLNITECKKGQGSVVAGITKMLDYKHIITPNSLNVIKEFNNYIWNDRKSGVPIDNFNHAIDAGRYAFDKLTTKRYSGLRM